MSTNLATVFPQLNDPAWLAGREQCWQLALEVSSWKSDYRKKDLDKIRHYFFTGELIDGMVFSDQFITLLRLFPIQTHDGYVYYYKQHDFSKDKIERLVKKALLSSASSGHRAEEQKAYWDYHLGSTFEKTRVFQTATQRIEVEVNEQRVGLDMLLEFVRCFRSQSALDKYSVLVDFFISIYRITTLDVNPTKDGIYAWGRLFSEMDKFFAKADFENELRLQLAQRFQDELERSDSVFPEAVLTLWREHKANRTA